MSRNKGTVKAERERTDRERLELFVRRVDELTTTNIAQKGFNIEYKVQGGKDIPTVSILQQPEEIEVKEHLMIFRQFISEDKDVSLNRIFNICHQHLVSDEVKQLLAQARQIFGQVQKSNGLNITVGGVQMTPSYVMDMYINGRYFHNDLEYQTKLDSLDSLTADVVRYQFLSYMESITSILIYVQRTISRAFEENLFNF